MKSIIYKIISGILFPVAFVSLFFVIGGTEHGTTCWIGFASIILSYVMLIAVPLYQIHKVHIFLAQQAELLQEYFFPCNL